MNSLNPTVVVLIVAALGALARTVVPYLQVLVENPDTPFDRQFLVPPIVSCIIALITLPLALGALPQELLETPTVCHHDRLDCRVPGRVGRDGCGACGAKVRRGIALEQ